MLLWVYFYCLATFFFRYIQGVHDSNKTLDYRINRPSLKMNIGCSVCQHRTSGPAWSPCNCPRKVATVFHLLWQSEVVAQPQEAHQMNAHRTSTDRLMHIAHKTGKYCTIVQTASKNKTNCGSDGPFLSKWEVLGQNKLQCGPDLMPKSGYTRLIWPMNYGLKTKMQINTPQFWELLHKHFTFSFDKNYRHIITYRNSKVFNTTRQNKNLGLTWNCDRNTIV